MKAIILFATVVLACACGNTKPWNTRPVSQNQKLDEGFLTPPNTIDFSVEDKKLQEYEVSITEENQYWQSLDNITDKIRTEALNIEICNEIAPNKSECGILKNNYCQTDMLLDTRGGHHNKAFCR